MNKVKSIKEAIKIYANSVRKDIIANCNESRIPLLVYTMDLDIRGDFIGRCNFALGTTQFLKGKPDIDDVVIADMHEINSKINDLTQKLMKEYLEKWHELSSKKD